MPERPGSSRNRQGTRIRHRSDCCPHCQYGGPAADDLWRIKSATAHPGGETRRVLDTESHRAVKPTLRRDRHIKSCRLSWKYMLSPRTDANQKIGITCDCGHSARRRIGIGVAKLIDRGE